MWPSTSPSIAMPYDEPDHIPAEAVLSDADHEALQTNGVGLLKPRALKTVRKLGALFEKRHWLVGHMFYTAGLHEWHFCYFDQRDTEAQRKNHWERGAHIHFVNWLWPNLEPRSLWADFVSQNKPPGGALHIRYDDRPLDERRERLGDRRTS